MSLMPSWSLAALPDAPPGGLRSLCGCQDADLPNKSSQPSHEEGEAVSYVQARCFQTWGTSPRAPAAIRTPSIRMPWHIPSHPSVR